MEPQQQRNDMVQEWKQSFNAVWNVAVIHQRAIVMPFRKNWGPRALGTSCFFALALMFLWAAFTNDPFLWAWLGLWRLCFLKRRYETAIITKSGARIHSEYDGFPHGTIHLGRTEKVAKRFIEPLFVGACGITVFWLYQDQGWSPYGLPYFLLAGVFTLPFVEAVK